MATTTPNYNLKKPGQNENYNVDDQNGNMDIIDAQLKENADDSAARIPNSLAAEADQVLVSTGVGAWAVKTLAQIKTWLGLGSAAYAAIVDDLTTTATGSVLDASQGKALSDLISTLEANKASLTGAETLDNKRINPRIGSIATGTPSPNADTHDQYNVTALAAGVTVAAPTGTPVDGQKLLLRFKDNGTSRALAWNAIYRAVGITLPTTTVISKTLYVGCIYNSADSKWDALAVGQEA